MRTNIELDDDLVKQAFAVTGIRTKRELINTALRELVRVRKKKNLLELAGKIEFSNDFDHKQLRELRHGAD